MCMAIQTSSPGGPPDRWSHGTFAVDELEDRVQDETQDHFDFGDDTEFESETKAIVDAQEPTFHVLATWKQTRTSMTQEKLRR